MGSISHVMGTNKSVVTQQPSVSLQHYQQYTEARERGKIGLRKRYNILKGLQIEVDEGRCLLLVVVGIVYKKVGELWYKALVQFVFAV